MPLSQGKIRRILEEQGVSCPEEYLVKNLGLSLTDYYWIRPLDSELTRRKAENVTSNTCNYKYTFSSRNQWNEFTAVFRAL